MEQVELIDKKITQLGIPSDIRGNIAARLITSRDEKLKDIPIFEKRFLSYLLDLHDDGLNVEGLSGMQYVLNAMAACCFIVATLVYFLSKNETAESNSISFIFISAGFLVFSGMMMLFIALNRTIRERNRSDRNREVIIRNCDQTIQALYCNPVVFLREAIEYCRAEHRNFNIKINQARSEFKIAVTDPKDSYAAEIKQCQEDLIHLRDSDPEEIPGLEIAIAAREVDLEYYTLKLNEKMPQEVEIEAKIISLEDRSKKVNDQIDQLVALKTKHESIDEIMQRARGGNSADKLDDVIEQNKQKQLRDISLVLDELEEDMGYMSEGIQKVFQSIPEPEQLPVNTSRLQLAA